VEFYPWVVIAHVLFVILSFGAHGVSAFAMFRVKSETDRPRMAAVLDLSTTSLMSAGIALLLAVLLGIFAAMMGGHFSRLWPWVAIAVVVVAYLLMIPLASAPMSEVRKCLGMTVRGDRDDAPPRQPGTDAELAVVQARLRPELVMAIGVAAIAILVWLMEMKPI